MRPGLIALKRVGPTRSFSRLFSVKQPEKLHIMSVEMRRQLLGIKNNRQSTGMSAYFPLGVVQLPYDVFGQSCTPWFKKRPR